MQQGPASGNGRATGTGEQVTNEVLRWKLKGFLPGVDGVSKALFQPWVVQAENFDRVIAERDALIQSNVTMQALLAGQHQDTLFRLKQIDDLRRRVDQLEGLLFALPDGLKDLSGGEQTAGVVASIQYIEYLIGDLKSADRG